ncbi:hypothetical protein [Mesorhizobium sp. M4B.F.Ca.ET.143.01.1.1]|uniref:hypothetical protein n=1 Tax=unclassified Mesorhizobium TaxID=325217 RepID=UPI0026CA3C28
MHDLNEDHLQVNWAEIKATVGKRFDVTLQGGLTALRNYNDELVRHLPRLQLDAGILTAMDGTNCTGCRRCTKVCSRKIMCLHGIDDRWSASYE